MSTIVQPISANGDTQDSSGKPKIGDYVIVISKGADNVITEKLASSSRNSQHFDQTLVIVDEDAKQGYRTLFIAQVPSRGPAWNSSCRRELYRIPLLTIAPDGSRSMIGSSRLRWALILKMLEIE